ncbi:MAG: hypothetical protein WAO00_14015 [Chthoniobacterales bacterium]
MAVPVAVTDFILVRRMRNIALIPIPSVTFSATQLEGRTVYPGINEFTHQMAERLRGALLANLECTAVKRVFKPYGSGFSASAAAGRYVVTVSIDEEVLPAARITILAEPRGKAARSWLSFEPRLKAAVETVFPDCKCQWMTVDEFIASGQSA